MMRCLGGTASRAIGTAALAAVVSACASTGAVPHPFPVPGGHGPHDAPGANDPAPPSGTPPPGATAGAPDPPPALPAPPAPTTSRPSPRVLFDGYALVGTALSLRGTPYRNGGSDPSGFDCSGFTQYVFKQY